MPLQGADSMSARALRELSLLAEAERDPLSGTQTGREGSVERPSHDSGSDIETDSSSSDIGASSQARSPAAQQDAARQEALTTFQRTLERFASGIVPSQELSGDTPASAAERHRLASNVGLDLPAVATWSEKALPFLLLLLCTFIYRHIQGIGMFLWLNMILLKANDALRKQAALKQDRSKRQCIGLAALMALHIGCVLLVLRKQELWLNFLLISTAAVPTAWDVFFRVALVDVLVRYWGIALKAGVLVMHKAGSRMECRKRSQILTVLEHALVFCRHLLPTPVWYAYFIGGATKTGMLSNSTAILYMVLKISNVWERGQLLVVSAKALAQSQASYGKAVSPAELCEIGNQCSICQEAFTQPLKLSCNHVFCEACIAEWHERERTCPMCRAVVQPPGLNLHSDGSTPLLPCLF